jgi:uncharacterized protein YdaT
VLGKFVDGTIIKVRQVKDVNGSLELQNAMLDLLYFEKKIVSTAFLPFEKMTANTTKKEIDDALAKLTEIVKPEDEKLNAVRKAQQAYALKNGFKIAEQ